jgi:hypothetical protein
MVSKKNVAQAIIQKVEQDHDDVKIMTSMVEGYEKPEKIMSKEEQEEGYIPDVMLRSDDITELYEIDLDQNYKLDRWGFFSRWTSKENGSFSIVTPEEHVNPLRSFLKKNNIEARILFFS